MLVFCFLYLCLVGLYKYDWPDWAQWRESVCDRHRGHTESRVSHQLFSFSTFFDLLCGLRRFLSSVAEPAGSSSGGRAWPRHSPCWLKGWVVRTASHLQFTASANITVTSLVTCQQTDSLLSHTSKRFDWAAWGLHAFTLQRKFCLSVVFMWRLRPWISFWTGLLSS